MFKILSNKTRNELFNDLFNHSASHYNIVLAYACIISVLIIFYFIVIGTISVNKLLLLLYYNTMPIIKNTTADVSGALATTAIYRNLTTYEDFVALHAAAVSLRGLDKM